MPSGVCLHIPVSCGLFEVEMNPSATSAVRHHVVHPCIHKHSSASSKYNSSFLWNGSSVDVFHKRFHLNRHVKIQFNQLSAASEMIGCCWRAGMKLGARPLNTNWRWQTCWRCNFTATLSCSSKLNIVPSSYKSAVMTLDSRCQVLEPGQSQAAPARWHPLL